MQQPAGAIDVALNSPPREVGSRLIALPENQWFDRKSTRIEPKKLAESIVAFANADGGTIVVGLNDGVVEGVDADPKRLAALQQTAMDFTDPTVPTRSALCPCVNHAGEPDHLLVIDIPPGRTVYATHRDESFLRLGDESRRLTFAQRRELFYDKNQSAFESELTGVGLSAVESSLLDEYARELSASDPVRLLEARGLADGGVFTIAGLLLFAEHPEHELPSAQVRVTRFGGVRREYGARQNLLIDERLEGPIPVLLEQARARIAEHQPTRRALTVAGRFEDIALVPEDVWLEGLVNAVVHRSYSVQGDCIHVDVYDDRIEIESPGRFPGLVDPDKPLSITRFARNPRIARVCTDLRITQELGEGIRRMFDEMHRAGLSDPMYRQTSGSVRLILSGASTQRELTERLPAAQQRILEVLRETPELSTGEVAEAAGVARPTALRHLDKLRAAKYVEWTGKSAKDPHASWRLPR